MSSDPDPYVSLTCAREQGIREGARTRLPGTGKTPPGLACPSRSLDLCSGVWEDGRKGRVPYLGNLSPEGAQV